MSTALRVAISLAAAALFATAQNDPPGRVGRMNYLSGSVSFRPGDVDDWVPAEINRPLTTGDHLWTDDDSRVELHVGAAAMRLDSRTAFQFLNLDDNNVQIRIAEGSLNVRLRALDEQESFEIDTPNLALSLLRPGDYRIDVNPDRMLTVVVVRAGDAEVTGGGQAFTLHARQRAEVSGDDSLSYNVLPAGSPDEWDGWCFARDRREDQSRSAQYVSRDMVGYEDLDEYGDWSDAPDYGPVWIPRTVAVGWSPYHFGHWVWIEPWGWTWVDDAPWGFAPFHYGRWVYFGAHWAWVPGPARVRPVYAPALVAWIGGPRFGISLSFGVGAGIAWIPLGPREVYLPAYRASEIYVRRVNVTNTVIVNNINVTNVYTNNYRFVNRDAPGAVAAMPHTAFALARPVQSAAVPVRPDALRNADVLTAAPVAPSRESVLGRTAGTGRVSQPPIAVQNRTVVARRTPPPPPVPFAQRRQLLSTNPGRPLDSTEVQRIRAEQPPAARNYVRPAQRGTGPEEIHRPAVNPEPPQRTNEPPPQRDYQPPPARQPQPRDTIRPPTPPPARETRPDRPVEQPRPQIREVPQPRPERPAEAPRPVQREATPPPRTERPPETPRPAQREAPPPRTERPAEPPRPAQREVQRETPPARPERPQREERREQKQEEKKDTKDTKKQ